MNEEKKHCKWYNEEFCTNDKSPCVADYCPCVEYPEVCKFREVAMDKKKISILGLTKEEIAGEVRELREVVEQAEKDFGEDINVRSKDDTEIDVGMIVKGLECVAGITQSDCDSCPFMIANWCNDTELSKATLDLIHRLQSENESLKKKIDELPKPRKKILANKVYSDSTLKKWSKEDLIEQIRILEHNWASAEESLSNSVANSEKIFAEQKAEIERLTKKCDFLQKDNDNLFIQKDNLVNENAELQKQVDELTEQRNKWREKAIELNLCQGQAVKDTAKEIYDLLNLPLVKIQIIDIIKDRYGVEVE